jgi:homoserine kinase
VSGSGRLGPARVRVPCSTSNLGAGYDTIGLALDRYLDVTFEPAIGGDLSLERSGTLRRLEAEAAPDLVATTLARELEARGARASGVLRMHSDIPIARGLGTSAAAVLAGHDLARAALGEGRDDEATFDAALRHEGHGDNAAPSLFGGLRAVAGSPEGPVVMGLTLSPSVGFAYAAPAVGVSTRESRSRLPSELPHEVAAHALGRLVALVQGLAAGNPELLRVGMTDELHVPYRLALIPRGPAAIEAGLEAGAWAVTVSGAGSGLIATCDPGAADAVAAAMHAVFDGGEENPECVGFSVRPSESGLQRLPIS